MKIFTEFDLETERYVLMADCGRMAATPAGPRLFRGPPHPAIQFNHPTPEAAEVDAVKLRQYLAGLNSKKPSKKEKAAHAE